jgi:hypothetical protein
MKPVILLAFANDNDDYLPMIVRERKNIYKTLQNHHDKGYVQVHKEESTAVADIFELFTRYDNQIAIIHYGGHANGTHLQLETVDGKAEAADARGLAQLMGQQGRLQLVFLNGCATREQVDVLLAAGVKAVIATSVPIEDKMAVEFSEQFYNSLAGQATIKKAFGVAKAFILSKYGTDKGLQHYDRRAINWQGREEETAEPMPWGLYSNEEAPEALDWKLPVSSGDSAILRNVKAVVSNGAEVNTKLIETLFHEVASHSPELGYLLEAYKRSKRFDIRMVRQAIIDSFPVPVGEQLRRLFAGNSIDVNRLQQLVATYKTIIELLCFTMLSQLWDARYKNPELAIPEDVLVQFNSFFALSADSYPTFDYTALMEAISGIFKENKINCFVEELETLGKRFLEKDEFYQAHLFMEEMKLELAEENVKAEEIESFCVQAEQHLGTILANLSFFVKYKLTTVKRIELIKRRHKDPRYLHVKVILDRVTAGILDEETVYDAFTDNDSVILLKDVEDVTHYLSLSPFVIDENALTGHQNSKLFFYGYQDTANSRYYYKFIDNEIERLAVNEKYPQVKEEIEEFKHSVFGEAPAP